MTLKERLEALIRKMRQDADVAHRYCRYSEAATLNVSADRIQEIIDLYTNKAKLSDE